MYSIRLWKAEEKQGVFCRWQYKAPWDHRSGNWKIVIEDNYKTVSKETLKDGPGALPFQKH